MSETSPLLEALRVRIDAGGEPAIDGLTLTTRGDHVIVASAPRALFEAVAGVRAIAHGTMRVGGVACDRASSARENVIAGAPLDPPMPPKWTPRDYIEWSARLAGHSARDATKLAKTAIDDLGLAEAARLSLAKSTRIGRRATVIAAAIATGAAIVALEDPLLHLEEGEARVLGDRTLASIRTRGMRSITFASRPSIASPFAAAADEAILIEGSTVAVQGAPLELASRARTYSLRVAGDSAIFAASAQSRGANVVADGARVTIDLGDALTTRDLFAIAAESSTTILELRSIARAFA